MPDAVMQDEATTAALKYLTKQNPRYLMTADVQRKKKGKTNKNDGKENTYAHPIPTKRT
jgi:hypothetical protein